VSAPDLSGKGFLSFTLTHQIEGHEILHGLVHARVR